jgi:ribosomal-protein-serine acetyltransferase
VTPAAAVGETGRVLPLSLSDRCLLRLHEPGDAEELYARIDADRASLSEWLPWAADESLDDTRRFIRTVREQVADDNGLQALVVYDDAIAGSVGFHAVDWRHGSTSIGYWLGEPYRGRGIMTQAVRALVDHALSAWELHRVEIRAAVDNRRSRAIPERLGFSREGILREAERVRGRYLDEVVYSMLAPEWPPGWAPGSPD